jgi:hypothetical protein
MLTKKDLEEVFTKAKKDDYEFIGVKIEMQGFEMPEIIINPKQNFDTKLAYYTNAYNDDLTLKTFNGIRIIDCACGDSYSEIQSDLERKM